MAQILGFTSAPLSHMSMYLLQRPHCGIASPICISLCSLCHHLHPRRQTHSQNLCVTKRVPPSVKNTHMQQCVHTQRHEQTHFAPSVWNSKQLSGANRCPQHQRSSASHHQCLTCLLQRDSLVWWGQLQVNWKVKQLVRRGSTCAGEGFLLWKEDLTSLAPIQSPHVRSRLFTSSIASSRMPIYICAAMFSSCLNADTYSPIHQRNVCSVFFTGHVYLCLIKQAPQFLLPGSRQEVCWHDIQAWPRRRDLPQAMIFGFTIHAVLCVKWGCSCRCQ